jgi:hypothetical protein
LWADRHPGNQPGSHTRNKLTVKCGQAGSKDSRKAGGHAGMQVRSPVGRKAKRQKGSQAAKQPYKQTDLQSKVGRQAVRKIARKEGM